MTTTYIPRFQIESYRGAMDLCREVDGKPTTDLAAILSAAQAAHTLVVVTDETGEPVGARTPRWQTASRETEFRFGQKVLWDRYGDGRWLITSIFGSALPSSVDGAPTWMVQDGMGQAAARAESMRLLTPAD